MTSRYAEAYRRSLADPEGFWGDAAEAIDWDKPWDRVLDASRPPFYRWFTGGATQHLLQRARPPRGARPRRPDGADLRQPGHRHDQALHLSGAARRGGAARRRACRRTASRKATASSSTCRWCRRRSWPCSPARASAPIHSVVFGGFAAPELAAPHRRRQAQDGAVGLLRHRGQPRHSLQAAAGPGDRSRQGEARSLPHPPAPAADMRAGDGPRSRLGRGMRQGQAGRLRAGRGHRPALYPLHLGHHRRAQGHHARQWRPCRGARLVDGERLRHQARRDLVHRLGRGLGGGAQLYRLRAADLRHAPASCSRASRWARPTPAPSGG